MRKRLFSLFIVVTLAAVTVQSGYALPSGAPTRQANCQSFPETGKTVCGRFLTYWKDHGALAQQGYPISNEFQEVSDVNGKTYTVQYFERAVFEMHPENKPPYDVLLSLLGSIFYKQRYPSGKPDLPNIPVFNPLAGSGRYFPETGQRVTGVFLDYWLAHGGLAQQGYPISVPFYEQSPLDSKLYAVQYFERAVFEWHKENKPPYDVLLSQLGTLRFKQKYPNGEPGSQPGDQWAALSARPLNLPTVAPGSPCPAAKGKIVSSEFAAALGDGPIYPVGLGTDGVMYYDDGLVEGGWTHAKVLWVGRPDYQGPVLVRGHQIDGTNELRFERGPDPPKELHLQTDPANAGTTNWSNWPSYTRLQTPGCYAYQVDGVGISEVIVFKAVNEPPPPAGP
jgi:hypothetical protein